MLRRALFAIALGMMPLAMHPPSIAKLPADSEAAKSRKPAPAFALPDSKGSAVNLANYKGKVVLLNFWATWCHGCQIEIPWFIQFQEKYKNAGLAVIGVSMDDDGWESVNPWIAEKKVSYIIVIGNEILGKSYGLAGMPMTLLIDREGGIAASYSGVVDKAACESEIRELLQEGANSTSK